MIHHKNLRVGFSIENICLSECIFRRETTKNQAHVCLLLDAVFETLVEILFELSQIIDAETETLVLFLKLQRTQLFQILLPVIAQILLVFRYLKEEQNVVR